MTLKSIAAGVMSLSLGVGAVVALRHQPSAAAQVPPPATIRPTDLRAHAIINGRVVVKPGTVLERAAILVRDGVIEAVGGDVEIPPDARVWDAEGKTVYPGLIEPALLIKPAEPPRAGGAHWNPRIRPELSMIDQPAPDKALRKELRGLGFAVAAVYPNAGALRGSGAVIALADDDAQVLAYRQRAAMAAAFDYGGGGYPGSLMGAIALLRQTLYDAQWHLACRRVWQEHPAGHEPPARAESLEALADVLDRRQPLLFEVSDEHNALRAARLAQEFNLNMTLLGSGLEFRRLDEVLATRLGLIVPLDFPKRPDVSTMSMADSVSLRDLMTWEQAPTNPRRLAALAPEGSLALTTHKLKSRGEFHANLRSAIRHGLTEDQALAALTTAPARMLGIDGLVGTIEAGKAANLVVVKGSLFEKDGKIQETWVNGRRHEIASEAIVRLKGKGTMQAGTQPERRFNVEFDSDKSSLTLKWENDQKVTAKKVIVQQDQVHAVIEGRPFDVDGFVQLGGVMNDRSIAGTGMLPDGSVFPFAIEISPVDPDAPGEPAETTRPDVEGAAGDAGEDDDAEQPADPVTGNWTFTFGEQADNMSVTAALRLEGTTLSGSLQVMGQTIPIENGSYEPGARRVTFSVAGPTGQPATTEGTITGGTMTGTVSSEAFTGAFSGTREGAGGEKKAGSRGAADEEESFMMPPEDLNHPLGEYGFVSPPAAQDMLFTNATIWTCGEQGVIENGWLLIRGGTIDSLGAGEPPAVGGEVGLFDCAQRHITPGLIDCHSHTGVDGSVNEGSQSNSAEVRIADCIDPDDISWYREMAGGLTAANQLHGSANAIGGQNSVVKIKWGHPASEFPIPDAIGGIKFALGENVKRTNNRYPNTRMGVEQWIRDAFTAADEYRKTWDRFLSQPAERRQQDMPPRRDLELDALVEILNGQRIIHCHSYRQDEILMLIRVADDFEFTIGTFQHVLEGYKVADAIAKHGAGGSSFSDWWAYKIEVMDAIPHNGALMTDVGVLTSFNSDSDELARRMNTEAAKAVRYGGLEPSEALKLVTINPAKQLRIDHRTGSLEPGKDADLVVWSGDPLSTYTRCEQTWIDGARCFDLETDQRMRQEIVRERQRIVQRILTMAHGKPGKNKDAGETTQPASAPGTRPATSPDVANSGRRGVMSRLIDQQLAWFEEQARLGKDPALLSPGDCGCGAGSLFLQAGE